MSLLTQYSSKDALAADVRTWAERALTITDRASCIHAAEYLRSVKILRGQVQAWFEPHIERAKDTKRAAEAQRKALADECDRMAAPLVERERALKGALLAFEAAQERARLDEEARLQAEAQAHAETITLAAAAELEREATASGDEGMRAEAHALMAQPIEAHVVAVVTSMPRVDGISYRDHWEAHPVIDVMALAGAVANGLAPEAFLTPDLPAINAFARATKGLQPVPGVRFWNNRQVVARG